MSWFVQALLLRGDASRVFDAAKAACARRGLVEVAADGERWDTQIAVASDGEWVSVHGASDLAEAITIDLETDAFVFGFGEDDLEIRVYREGRCFDTFAIEPNGKKTGGNPLRWHEYVDPKALKKLWGGKHSAEEKLLQTVALIGIPSTLLDPSKEAPLRVRFRRPVAKSTPATLVVGPPRLRAGVASFRLDRGTTELPLQCSSEGGGGTGIEVVCSGDIAACRATRVELRGQVVATFERGDTLVASFPNGYISAASRREPDATRAGPFGDTAAFHRPPIQLVVHLEWGAVAAQGAVLTVDIVPLEGAPDGAARSVIQLA